MNQEKALNILVQAVQVGQAKGAYNLQEAKIIAEAVEVFTKKPEDAEHKTEEKKDESPVVSE